MKILVTGAKGFVGRNLCHALRNIRDGKDRTRDVAVSEVFEYDLGSTREQLEERRALYTPQLRAYAAAMERIFKKRVKECVLYFLSMGKEARIEIGKKS